jgi:DivIVA domain-containing protein
MGQLLLLLVSALVIAGIGFGVVVLITGSDPGLSSNEPDGRAVPLPGTRPLVEADVAGLRFDTAIRGYRMSQVDAALRRAAYDIGYKEELIAVLTAETDALRAGRFADADALLEAREAALEATRSSSPAIVIPSPTEPGPVDIDLDAGGSVLGAEEPEPEPEPEPKPDSELEPAAEVTRTDEPDDMVDTDEPAELAQAAKPAKKGRPAKRQSTGMR